MTDQPIAHHVYIYKNGFVITTTDGFIVQHWKRKPRKSLSFHLRAERALEQAGAIPDWFMDYEGDLTKTLEDRDPADD